MAGVSTAHHAPAAKTTSQPIKFMLGTGSQILSSILPACLATNHELIIVTCFWAKSKSRDDVSQLLKELSDRAISIDPHRRIRVRLCLSSVSLRQKLLQTSSLDGMVYLPSKWKNIGLPKPDKLRGLDLVVKSIFVRPFSVMHPKFVLVDRERVFMPSCNVSWEDWFEGCMEMEGDIARKVFEFWKEFWGRGVGTLPEHLADGFRPPISSKAPLRPAISQPLINEVSFSFDNIATILLPSPHHQDPRFRPFRASNPPPRTALNAFLLKQIADAQCSIYIQTPNLTCKPFIASIFEALTARGIDVSIVTSRRLMILEQLLTAGTITEFEIWKLKRRYSSYLKNYDRYLARDPEARVPKPGQLSIAYYKARDEAVGEPVKSHLKLTIIDDKIVVLGSGNQDRASWYTSQELGISFHSKKMARGIKTCVDEGLEGRIEQIL